VHAVIIVRRAIGKGGGRCPADKDECVPWPSLRVSNLQ
jgi:hypothetical protein